MLHRVKIEPCMHLGAYVTGMHESCKPIAYIVHTLAAGVLRQLVMFNNSTPFHNV